MTSAMARFGWTGRRIRPREIDTKPFDSVSAPLEARDVRPRDRKAARSVDPGSHTAKNQTLDKSSARERAHARGGRVRATYLDILVGPLAEELDLSRSDRHSFRWSVRALVIRGLGGCAFPLFVLFSFVPKNRASLKFVWANRAKGAKNNPKDAVRLISDFRKERYKRLPVAPLALFQRRDDALVPSNVSSKHADFPKDP
mgnify:FL=1